MVKVRLLQRENYVFYREDNKPSRKESSMKHLTNFLRDDRGQDMVEYGLLGAFISIVAIATLRLIGPHIERIFEEIELALR
jgi:Flp pilus assembly pilin Flp